MKKIYIGLGVLAIVIIVVGGIYWQLQKTAVSPIEKELADEEESLNQDIGDLEELNEDAALNALDEDLIDVSEEEISIEDLESELAAELNDFSGDFNELEGLEGDASFDNLDNGLSAAVE